MLFLIGVIIIIVFIIIGYIIVRIRLRRMLDQFGYVGMNLKDIVEQARIEDQEVPKSLSSMDSVYLDSIRKDFPDLNINELKREAEKIVLDCYNAIENKNTGNFKGKIKSFIEASIDDYKDKDIKFDDIRIHNTVISKYKKEEGIVTLTFTIGFQYYLVIDGNSKKVQDRCRCEYIYVYDVDKVDNDLKVLGLNCPNCGSPIKSLGQKKCAYCGTGVLDIVKRVFTCCDVVRY